MRQETPILWCLSTVLGPSALPRDCEPTLQQMKEVAICKHTSFFFLDVSHGDIRRLEVCLFDYNFLR